MTTPRRYLLWLATTITGLALVAPAAQAASIKPAGGAALDQVAIATRAAILLTAALAWLGIGYRTGKVPWLGRLADWSARISGLPAWAALPAGIASGSLVTAVFGMYWDISLHIAVGRDPGPLANPAHYFILAGLFGIFAAGFFAIVLPRERPGPTAVWVSRDWYAPLGGVLICACALFSLVGFPLDDFWHRLFGQDVTLWGPTHLMLIGGASLSLIGIAVLLTEAARARRATASGPLQLSWMLGLRRVGVCGALLVGLSTFQGEFDFGVPQFRLVFAPMLVMLAAGVALTVARLWAGRGGALGAVLFFLLIRGGLAILVGPVLGDPAPRFPLYLAEALVVEALALPVSPRERPWSFAALSGLGIGTVGLTAEWGWSHVWMPLPWPAAQWPSGALLGLGMAVAGALLGTWIGSRLASDGLRRATSLRPAAITGAVVVAALVMVGLYRTDPTPTSAHITLSGVGPGPRATVNATVQVSPSSAANHAQWLTATAWQGGGLVVDRLRRVAEGRYVTTRPLPVYGDWKTVIRLGSGTTLAAVPVYMPADAAIPIAGIPVLASVSQPFRADHQLLQRESRISPGLVPDLAYCIVAAITLALLATLAWGLHRLGCTAPDQQMRASRSQTARRVEREPALKRTPVVS